MNRTPAYIAPSVLSCDPWQLKEQITALEEAGCRYLHLDVMDGHFVPNISFGPMWLPLLRPHTDMIFDAHLMVEEPDFLLEMCQKGGCEYVTVHAEAVKHLDRMIQRIRQLGMKPGVSLNPATPVSLIQPILHLVDLVLVMSVNPGFGGQSYIPYCTDKVKELAAFRKEHGLSYLIEVDGGVSPANAGEVAHAGADLLVAGSAVLGQADPAAAFRRLTEIANA